jgi:hypothetical protein
MIKSTTSPNSASHYDNDLYKKRLGKNFSSEGTHFLSCSPIYKIGLFCDQCRKELEESGLVDSP